MNSIPGEIRSRVRIYKSLYLKDFIIIVGIWAFFSYYDGLVNERLNAAYQVFNILVACYLVQPSRMNIGRQKMHSILFHIIRDRRIYHIERIPEADSE